MKHKRAGSQCFSNHNSYCSYLFTIMEVAIDYSGFELGGILRNNPYFLLETNYVSFLRF